MADATWLLDLPLADAAWLGRAPAALSCWRAQDAGFLRAYLQAAVAPSAAWQRLLPLQALDGASAGAVPAFHYVVETDVLPEHEADLKAWYEEEHLPGLAAVPGTVRATRFRRETGSPAYLACYDLLTPDTLKHPAWLAVRHTAWSSRVRPLFVNPRRTMFVRPSR